MSNNFLRQSGGIYSSQRQRKQESSFIQLEDPFEKKRLEMSIQGSDYYDSNRHKNQNIIKTCQSYTHIDSPQIPEDVFDNQIRNFDATTSSRNKLTIQKEGSIKGIKEEKLSHFALPPDGPTQQVKSLNWVSSNSKQKVSNEQLDNQIEHNSVVNRSIQDLSGQMIIQHQQQNIPISSNMINQFNPSQTQETEPCFYENCFSKKKVGNSAQKEKSQEIVFYQPNQNHFRQSSFQSIRPKIFQNQQSQYLNNTLHPSFNNQKFQYSFQDVQKPSLSFLKPSFEQYSNQESNNNSFNKINQTHSSQNHNIFFSPQNPNGIQRLKNPPILYKPGQIQKSEEIQQKIIWPIIIQNLKMKNSGICSDLETLFDIKANSRIQVQCVRIKKRIEDLIDNTIDTLWNITKTKEEIRQKKEQGDLKQYSNEYFFPYQLTVKNLSPVKSETSFNIHEIRLAQGIHELQKLEQQQFYVLQEASNQLQLCQPNDNLNKLQDSFSLDLWSAKQLFVLKGFKEDLKIKYEDTTIQKQLLNINLQGELQQIAQQNQSHLLIDKIRAYLNIGNNHSVNSKFFKQFMECLVDCDEVIQTTSIESDSVVWSYQAFLNSSINQINEQLNIIRVYLKYARQSQIALVDLQLRYSDFFNAIQEAEHFSINLQRELKLPFVANILHNTQQLQLFTTRKTQLHEYITDFTQQSNISQQQIMKILESQPLSYSLLTPFDEEISKITQLSLQALDKLQQFDIFVERLLSLEKASVKADQMYFNIEKWIIQNGEKPNSQIQLHDKLNDIQIEISNLILLKEQFSMKTNLKNLNEGDYLINPIIQSEQANIEGIINKIHQFKNDSLENSISLEYSQNSTQPFKYENQLQHNEFCSTNQRQEKNQNKNSYSQKAQNRSQIVNANINFREKSAKNQY